MFPSIERGKIKRPVRFAPLNVFFFTFFLFSPVVFVLCVGTSEQARCDATRGSYAPGLDRYTRPAAPLGPLAPRCQMSGDQSRARARARAGNRQQGHRNHTIKPYIRPARPTEINGGVGVEGEPGPQRAGSGT